VVDREGVHRYNELPPPGGAVLSGKWGFQSSGGLDVVGPTEGSAGTVAEYLVVRVNGNMRHIPLHAVS
jgi:hypothetical protein